MLPVILSAYCTAAYIGGYKMFKGNKWTAIGVAAFAVSPVSVPAGLALAFIAG